MTNLTIILQNQLNCLDGQCNNDIEGKKMKVGTFCVSDPSGEICKFLSEIHRNAIEVMPTPSD